LNFHIIDISTRCVFKDAYSRRCVFKKETKMNFFLFEDGKHSNAIVPQQTVKVEVYATQHLISLIYTVSWR
jgi:hypothetical protein